MAFNLGTIFASISLQTRELDKGLQVSTAKLAKAVRKLH